MAHAYEPIMKEEEINAVCDGKETLDFGNVTVGNKLTKTVRICNDYEDVQTYTIKMSNATGKESLVFICDTETFRLRPGAKYNLAVSFHPMETFQDYHDRIDIEDSYGPIKEVILKGKTTGPYVVCSHMELVLKTCVGRPAETSFHLENISDCATRLYFEVDEINSAFKIYPRRSSIGGNARIHFKIKFIPPFEGSVEKDIFCMITNQGPLLIRALGLCGRYEGSHSEPILVRNPFLQPNVEGVNASQSYAHRRWEKIIRIQPTVRVPPGKSTTHFCARNLSRTKIILHWQKDSRRNFCITPLVSTLRQNSSQNFMVTFCQMRSDTRDSASEHQMKCGTRTPRCTSQDSPVTSTLDGWVFWESKQKSLPEVAPWKSFQVYRGQTWRSSRVPIHISVTLIGQGTLDNKDTPPICCVAFPKVLHFASHSLNIPLSAAFVIRKISESPVTFAIQPPSKSEFTVRPMEGVMKDDTQVVVVNAILKKTSRMNIERWRISFNGLDEYMIPVLLTSTVEGLKISIGDGSHRVVFPPVHLGKMQEKRVALHNLSSFWTRVSHKPEELPHSVRVGPQTCILAPNQQVLQNWTFCPTHLGLNKESVHYEAIQIKSPRLTEIEHKALQWSTAVHEHSTFSDGPRDKGIPSSQVRQELEISMEIMCLNNILMKKPGELYMVHCKGEEWSVECLGEGNPDGNVKIHSPTNALCSHDKNLKLSLSSSDDSQSEEHPLDDGFEHFGSTHNQSHLDGGISSEATKAYSQQMDIDSIPHNCDESDSTSEEVEECDLESRLKNFIYIKTLETVYESDTETEDDACTQTLEATE